MKNNFILGTAQFGSNYGITNQFGQPSLSEIEKILDFIFEKKIHYLDTALSYGNSSEILGSYLNKNKLKNIKIITKFSLLNDFEQTYTELSSFLDTISYDSFYGILIHDAEKLENNSSKKLDSFLSKLVTNKLTQKIGLSVYHCREIKTHIADIPINIIQCPVNLFNQSFLSPEIIKPLKEKNIEVHARSIFLQGLLLSASLPNKLKNLLPHWENYQILLQQLGTKSLDLILSWTKNQHVIDKWLIGVNSLNEMQDIVNTFENVSSTAKYFDLDKLDISDNPLTDPRHWKNL